MPYLDYNATTPVDSQVLRVMVPLFADHFGNPSSNHESGRAAAQIVEEARGRVADAVGMGTSDVVFTSGATEANNLALVGPTEGAWTDHQDTGRSHRAQVRPPYMRQPSRCRFQVQDDPGPSGRDCRY